MPDNSKEGWGKGRRSLSRIGCQHKNKFWKKKVDIELLSDKHLDGIADDRGEEHTSVDILDQIEEAYIIYASTRILRVYASTRIYIRYSLICGLDWTCGLDHRTVKIVCGLDWTSAWLAI